MFADHIDFRRKKRIDFRDHRRWTPARSGLSGLGQGTGIEELEYSGPLSVAPTVPPTSTFLQSLTSLFKPALNVASQYLTLRQTRAQAGAISRLPSGYPATMPGYAPPSGGIPWGTVLLGGGVLAAGYFILSRKK